jgi:hypothetical protein
MVYTNTCLVSESALKHGVSENDARFAAERYIVAFPLGDDPPRELRLGFDTHVRLLETVVLTVRSGTRTVIHAMPARRQYVELLPREEKQ